MTEAAAGSATRAAPAMPSCVEDIHTFYGAIEALKGISLDRQRG